MTGLLLALELDPYRFACDGPLLGVPHGANVLTNLPFLVLGLWGLARLGRGALARPADRDRVGLWTSVLLLAFGSGAYHLLLTPASLAADRVCIAAILAFVVAEVLAVTGAGPRAGPRRAAVTLGVLALSEGSVLAWWLGATSLIYGALQALGAVLVLALTVRGWRRGTVEGVALRSLVRFTALYALAKGAEALDEPLCHLTGVLAGHPLKHLLAAAGLAALLPFLGRPATPPPAPRAPG